MKVVRFFLLIGCAITSSTPCHIYPSVSFRLLQIYDMSEKCLAVWQAQSSKNQCLSIASVTSGVAALGAYWRRHTPLAKVLFATSLLSGGLFCYNTYFSSCDTGQVVTKSLQGRRKRRIVDVTLRSKSPENSLARRPDISPNIVYGDLFFTGSSKFRADPLFVANILAAKLSYWCDNSRKYKPIVVAEGDWIRECWATSRDKDDELRPAYGLLGTATEGIQAQGNRIVTDMNPNFYWRTRDKGYDGQKKRADKWSNGHPLLFYKFPTYLPSSLFAGMQERNVLYLSQTSGNNEVVYMSLTISQQDYRARHITI